MSADNAIRGEAIRTMVVRSAYNGVPVLLRIAKRDVPELRVDAVRALGELATVNELPEMSRRAMHVINSQRYRHFMAQATVTTGMNLERHDNPTTNKNDDNDGAFSDYCQVIHQNINGDGDSDDFTRKSQEKNDGTDKNILPPTNEVPPLALSTAAYEIVLEEYPREWSSRNMVLVGWPTS